MAKFWSAIALGLLTIIGLITWQVIEEKYLAWQESRISADIRYDERMCSPGQPLLVEIENDSLLAVEKVCFDIDGLNDLSDAIIYTTRFGSTVRNIILPDRKVAFCVTIPDRNLFSGMYETKTNDAEELTWRSMITSVEFL